MIPTIKGLSFKKFVLKHDMSKITPALLGDLNIKAFYEMSTALKSVLRFPDSTSMFSEKMRTDWEFVS